ncbi:MAG: hypothetical protein OEL20_11880 [Sulfuritalea sp.]|nr:hypothetical protein [Sulfuritalea sp.]
MTVCPIAIVAGCRKCPAFRICPLKGVLGDKPSAPEEQPGSKTKVRAGTAKRPRAAARTKK